MPGENALAEALRTVRAVVEALAARSVLVVGVDIDATPIASALAESFARSNRRTVLADADLRQPALRPAMAGEPDAPGLAEWLSGQTPDSEPPPLIATSLPNLSILPAGRLAEIAVDMVDSPRLETLVPTLLREADRVVIAAPPLDVAADALPYARRVDGVLLVIAPGHTHTEAATRATEALRAAGGTILGVILADGH